MHDRMSGGSEERKHCSKQSFQTFSAAKHVNCVLNKHHRLKLVMKKKNKGECLCVNELCLGMTDSNLCWEYKYAMVVLVLY